MKPEYHTGNASVCLVVWLTVYITQTPMLRHKFLEEHNIQY